MTAVPFSTRLLPPSVLSGIRCLGRRTVAHVRHSPLRAAHLDNGIKASIRRAEKLQVLY